MRKMTAAKLHFQNSERVIDRRGASLIMPVSHSQELVPFQVRRNWRTLAWLGKLAVAFLALMLLGAAAFAQKAGTEGGGSRFSDELTKDNSAVVAASAEQIQGVLRGDPGLLLELKQWIANEVAKRGQVLLEDDLSDAEILRRLAWDRDLRLAATRLLQRYGHLLPSAKPFKTLHHRFGGNLGERASLD